jgi:hypothetical protein
MQLSIGNLLGTVIMELCLRNQYFPNSALKTEAQKLTLMKRNRCFEATHFLHFRVKDYTVKLPMLRRSWPFRLADLRIPLDLIYPWIGGSKWPSSWSLSVDISVSSASSLWCWRWKLNTGVHVRCYTTLHARRLQCRQLPLWQPANCLTYKD